MNGYGGPDPYVAGNEPDFRAALYSSNLDTGDANPFGLTKVPIRPFMSGRNLYKWK